MVGCALVMLSLFGFATGAAASSGTSSKASPDGSCYAILRQLAFLQEALHLRQHIFAAAAAKGVLNLLLPLVLLPHLLQP
jgi:hypothetical protein